MVDVTKIDVQVVSAMPQVQVIPPIREQAKKAAGGGLRPGQQRLGGTAQLLCHPDGLLYRPDR